MPGVMDPRVTDFGRLEHPEGRAEHLMGLPTRSQHQPRDAGVRHGTHTQRAAGLAASSSKLASGRGCLPHPRRRPYPTRRFAPPPTRNDPCLRNLIGSPPRARHPVAGKDHSQGRSLRSRLWWRFAPALSVLFPGKIAAPIATTTKPRSPFRHSAGQKQQVQKFALILHCVNQQQLHRVSGTVAGSRERTGPIQISTALDLSPQSICKGR
jgi:hypothetical protein